MSRRRIYEWMLHYRNVAERQRFRITRWKLTKAEAEQLAEECSGGSRDVAAGNYIELVYGRARPLGIPVVIR